MSTDDLNSPSYLDILAVRIKFFSLLLDLARKSAKIEQLSKKRLGADVSEVWGVILRHDRNQS